MPGRERIARRRIGKMSAAAMQVGEKEHHMSVAGKYEIHAVVLGKDLDGTCEVVCDANDIPTQLKGLDQTLDLHDVKVKGNTYTGWAYAPLPKGNTKVTATITVNGDEVEGTVKALLFKSSFKGHRISE